MQQRFNLGEVLAAYSGAATQEAVDPYEQELDKFQAQFIRQRFTPDPEVNAAIRARAIKLHEQLGGYLSVALFTRAYLELVNEGAIEPIRKSADEVVAAEKAANTVPDDVAEFIKTQPTSIVRKRYNSDPEFARLYDMFEKQEQEKPITLTAQQYRSTPTSVVAAKMKSDPAYKAAVEALFASGQV